MVHGNYGVSLVECAVMPIGDKTSVDWAMVRALSRYNPRANTLRAVTVSSVKRDMARLNDRRVLTAATRPVARRSVRAGVLYNCRALGNQTSASLLTPDNWHSL